MVLVGCFVRKVKESSYVLQGENQQLDIVSLEIFDQVMQTNNNPFWIDDLKLRELTQVFPIPVFLVRHDESRSSILLHLIVFIEEAFVDHLSNVLERMVHNGGDSTQIRSHQVIFFAIL